MAVLDLSFKPDVLVSHGPIIRVRVGFDAAFQAVPNVPPDERRALIDTGCADSAIAAELAEACI